MNLKECYEVLGGNYESVTSRFGGERLVFKYLYKFLSDSSFQTLTESLNSKNYDEAFRASHTIKGICQNLNLDKLQASSSLLTEALRNHVFENVEELYAQVFEDYQITKKAIEDLQKDN